MTDSLAIPRPPRTISSYSISNPGSVTGHTGIVAGSFEPEPGTSWGRTSQYNPRHSVMSEGDPQVHISPLRRPSSSTPPGSTTTSSRHSSSGHGGRMRQPLFGESFRTEEDGVPVKTVIVGESAVGKSSLAIRLCKGIFYDSMQNTVGAAYLNTVVSVGLKKIKFELWDTAGQERYHSLAPMYYRDASIAIIVYDITCKLSFEKAKNWVAELQTQMNSEMTPILALVGNKADLASIRQVPAEEARQFAVEERLVWTETSAATGANVHSLFEQLAREIPDEALSPIDLMEGTAAGRFLSSAKSRNGSTYRGGIGASTPRSTTNAQHISEEPGKCAC
eukprot:TRINITY_DN8006_c0_g1_i1.p1 TRINITY_DN8006_c0_g1~~TRINITY_DN8006_c0_g1_i1.p1  ORF type:complete len:335 (-),score=45.49 TRINITY_DN8006_c0_g1_i1:97-1101(-)